MLIDAHCHLDVKKYDHDRTEVLQRARANGVQKFVTIACDVMGSSRAIGLAKTHTDIFCTVGVHPHEAEKVEAHFEETLLELSNFKKCVAIGECGLDYYYDNSPAEKQKEVFRLQIKLANQVQKPLMIHVRDAWQDCLEILKEEQSRPGIIHCFSGNWDNAQASMDMGFYLSIPGIVSFKNAGELPDVVKKMPLERMLLETDSPFLAPIPHRGKRNEPAYVRHVAEKVAELRQISVAEVVEKTGKNAHQILGLSL